MLDAVTKLEAPFDIYKFDCKEMIPNSEAFKLRKALLSMKFKKKFCDLYSFSQSGDFLRLSNNQRPREVNSLLNVIRGIKQSVATYLNKQFTRSMSVSCSKYDRGGNFCCLYSFLHENSRLLDCRHIQSQGSVWRMSKVFGVLA